MYKQLAILLIFTFLSTNLFSQQVETLTEPFNGSGGITVDKSGNLYVSNFGSGFGQGDGNELYKVYPDGTVEEFATGLDGGSGNAVDSKGNIFQANIRSNTIVKITPEGEVLPFASDKLYSPVGVAIDSKDNVFVANCGSSSSGVSSIVKISPEGETENFANNLFFDCPNGLTIDENDNLYMCNYNNGRVFKITPNGSVSNLATLPGGNNSHLAYAGGSLYVAKRCDNKIYKLELDGSYELFAGTGERGNQDGNPLEATINLPNGLGASTSGDTLFFASKTSYNGACFDTDLNPVIIRMITGLNNTTSILGDESKRTKFSLAQCYPNPFNPTTTITYAIPQGASSEVSLKVFDLLGEEVAQLVDSEKRAGTYEVVFDASGLPSGVYFYVLRHAGEKISKKLTLLK